MHRRQIIKGMMVLPFAESAATSDIFSTLPAETEQGTGPGLYASLGVRPVINGRGTITIIGGCRILPEVERAMREATLDYVEIDELMEGAGRRLAELTGAEWGLVTTGATGALILATTGIVTGGDPDKLWQLPDLRGMKNEVIIPKYSWTAYESAVRGVGVKMITVDTPEELEAAIGPDTAMVLVLAGAQSMHGPLSVKEIAVRTKPLGIPIVVDAAAEGLPIPNPHLALGADLVAYSGGKYLRGPQCAGLLIGRKDLVKAAWVTSAPHHGFGRGYKVGREEILGMLAAVEMWMKRNHAEEIRNWTESLKYISQRLQKIAGVHTEILQPAEGELSNPSPNLQVSWDMAQIPLSGDEVEQLLWNGNPRVAVGGAGSFLPFPPNKKPNILINTSQLRPGEERVIADRVFAVLSAPVINKPIVGAAAFDISGEWDLEMKFAAVIANHKLVFKQKNNELTGTHFGEFASREITGEIYGQELLLRSSYTANGVRLNFSFTGTVSSADTMAGKVSLSEYGMAEWKAGRHRYH